jgi:hypothetical protein
MARNRLRRPLEGRNGATDRCGTDRWGYTCSIPFWLASGVDKQIAGCLECSCARAMSARSMGDRLCHRLPPLRAVVRHRTDGARRFLGHEGLLQSTEIAILEQPTDHALWNLARALCIEVRARGE